MATIITVANQKGGPGKTTTAINVSSCMHDAGYRVVVVDLDPQASFSKWNRRRTARSLKPLEVIPITMGLLQETVDDLRQRTDVDVVIIDCPGNIQDLTTRAVELSDAVLSPIRATWADMDATLDFARFVRKVQDQYQEVRFMLFLNATHPSRNIDKSARESLVKMFSAHSNTHILETSIPDCAPLAEFGGTGNTVFEYAPKASVSRLYKQLTKEVVACLIHQPVLS